MVNYVNSEHSLPHTRAQQRVHRNTNNHSIIQFFTKKNDDGDPRWFVCLFVFSMLFILSQGAIVFAPLKMLGVL